MSVTPHTTIRLSRPVKNKLLALCDIDNLPMSETINNLIVAEYRARREEITEYQKSMKNRDNLSNK